MKQDPLKTIDHPELANLLLLADTADVITKRYYLTSNLDTKTKPDKSPVTQADLAVEKQLSDIVINTFGDSYIGEEGTHTTSQNARAWVVDPIDGTRNFLRGMPVWATLIALSDADGPLASIVTAPALGRRWWAIRGHGAFTQDTDKTIRQLHVSRVAKISDAFLGHASLFSWDKTPVGTNTVLELLKSAWRHRGVGDFLNHMLVAEGALDACFEPDVKQWDIAAPALIVAEAGGSVWQDITPNTPAATPRIVITSNGLLEPALRQKIQKR